MAGIAQKLASNQKQVAISEFFEKNKHFLGFDSLSRSLITAVKEAVDNEAHCCFLGEPSAHQVEQLVTGYLRDACLVFEVGG